MMAKHRLSASIDSELLAAAERAVADGFAENVSAWVNAAMRSQAEHDGRMRALADFVGTYEAKHGTITDDEMAAATRRARARAIVARGSTLKRRRSA